MLFGKVLNKYYKKYALFFIIGIIALIAVDWIQLYIPEILGVIVDRLSPGYNPDELFHEVLLYSIQVVVIALMMAALRITWRITIFKASTGIEEGLKREMFLKAERLSLDYYQNNKVGTIMSWITSDTEEIQEFFGWGTIMLIDGIFLSICVIIKMFLLDVAITLLILIPVALIVIWGILVEKFMSDKWIERQKAFDKLYDFTQESFTGIRVIKSFVKENQQLFKFCKIAKKNEDVQVKFDLIGVGFDVIIQLIIALVLSLIIGFGSFLVFKNMNNAPIVIFGNSIDLTNAKLIEFISYFYSLVWPLIALGQVITSRSRAKGSLGRITAFLDVEESIKNDEEAIEIKEPKGTIRFDNFSFRYPNTEFDQLENISLEIKQGETVGVIGRIGSGKSTLVNALGRLYNVKENTLFIDDVDIMKIDLKSLRNTLAYVPQDNFLFCSTIGENIKFSNTELDDKKMKEATDFSDISKDIEGFPNKYDTQVGERGVTLSGGQKQRISIARAFIKDSPIMVLDDSVSAVDIKTEETILNNIKTLRKGKTTLVVASRVSTVKSLDKIIVLNDGKLEAFGSPKELEKTSKTYQKMVYLQRLEQEITEEGK